MSSIREIWSKHPGMQHEDLGKQVRKIRYLEMTIKCICISSIILVAKDKTILLYLVILLVRNLGQVQLEDVSVLRGIN